jgi:CubicO group peptidase (beta-lactamase class C family)
MNAKMFSSFSFLLPIIPVIVSLAGFGTLPEVSAGESTEQWEKFETKLEYLRQQMKIPGMSAAVVMDQNLVWAKGFGYADRENRIRATPDTPYHLASVTKTIAALLIMQLVQEGAVSLDDPVSKYGLKLESPGTILVRHLLTHTSAGVPGANYSYNGGRYACLGDIMKRATGKSFGTLVKERILDPLGMKHSWLDYQQIEIALGKTPYPVNWDGGDIKPARPYQLNPSYEVVTGRYSHGVNPAVGLVSTVVDMAKLDIALDRNVLLNEVTKANMLAPAIPLYPGRTDLMHGLGWFAQEYKGTRLNWHAGRNPPSVSANYIKVPEENLTFIIMANTAHLNTPQPHGDILYSTMALAFYEEFVFPRKYGRAVPDVNWEAGEEEIVDQLRRVSDTDLRDLMEKELWAYRQLFASVGKKTLADQLLQVHRQVYPDSTPDNAYLAGYGIFRLDMYTFKGVAYYPPDHVHIWDKMVLFLCRFYGRIAS